MCGVLFVVVVVRQLIIIIIIVKQRTEFCTNCFGHVVCMCVVCFVASSSLTFCSYLSVHRQSHSSGLLNSQLNIGYSTRIWLGWFFAFDIITCLMVLTHNSSSLLVPQFFFVVSPEKTLFDPYRIDAISFVFLLCVCVLFVFMVCLESGINI